MSSNAIARLADLLWPRRLVRRQRAADSRQRLERARRDARRWKQRADAAAVHRKALRQRLHTVTQALRDARGRLIAAARERRSVGVLEGVFVHRLATLPSRVGTPWAAEREAHLTQVSPAYRRVLEARCEPSDARPGGINGLVWWIPTRLPDHRRHVGAAEAPRIPFRGILQTRDLSIGGVMLDLGANVGRMSIPRVVLGDVSAAYCAEPDPVTFECLARNVIDNALRGLVLPDQMAIGDSDGIVKLLRTGSSGNFRVAAGAIPAGVEVVEVPCCRLDTWIERLTIDLETVTFIKVDVEGFERRVIAGAPRVLTRRHIAWQMEIKPAGLRAAGDDPADLYRDLQAAFTHFIDLNRKAVGPRMRLTDDLPEAMRYVEPDRKTDILLLSAPGAAAGEMLG
jgi:FkbM family methyltransferase